MSDAWQNIVTGTPFGIPVYQSPHVPQGHIIMMSGHPSLLNDQPDLSSYIAQRLSRSLMEKLEEDLANSFKVSFNANGVFRPTILCEGTTFEPARMTRPEPKLI